MITCLPTLLFNCNGRPNFLFDIIRYNLLFLLLRYAQRSFLFSRLSGVPSLTKSAELTIIIIARYFVRYACNFLFLIEDKSCASIINLVTLSCWSIRLIMIASFLYIKINKCRHSRNHTYRNHRTTVHK